MNSSVQYRMVAGGELAAILKAMKEPPVNQLTHCIGWIAEVDGNVVAISVVQSLPVVEPFYAVPGYGNVLGELFEKTKEFILESGAPRVLCHTSHPAMKKMLDMQPGMGRMADEMFDWRRP